LVTVRRPSRPPTVPDSLHGTPIAQANGARIQPRIFWTEKSGSPSRPPAQPRARFTRVTSAMNAIRIAPTLTASISPSRVPRAAASIRLASGRSSSSASRPSVSGASVSGTTILAR